MRTVWDIPNNKKREELSCGKHPTQKPERLIQRIFDVSMKSGGGRLLVPFAGSGTDCVVAVKNHAKFVAFELEETYANLARKRVDRILQQGDLFAI